MIIDVYKKAKRLLKKAILLIKSNPPYISRNALYAMIELPAEETLMGKAAQAAVFTALFTGAYDFEEDALYNYQIQPLWPNR